MRKAVATYGSWGDLVARTFSISIEKLVFTGAALSVGVARCGRWRHGSS